MENLAKSVSHICLACHGQKLKKEQLIPELVIMKCLRCHLLTSKISKPAHPQSEFDRINEHAYQAAIGKVRKAQSEKIISLVRHYDNLKTTWVDIGCSFGYMLSEARNTGYKIFGIEPDERAYKAASGLLGNDVIYLGLMSEDIIKDESADVISLLDVLEHIPADEVDKFVQVVRRKLRGGGLLVVKVPSTDGLYFQTTHKLLPLMRVIAPGILKRLWQTEYEFPHTIYFNSQNLALLLESQGFETVKLEYLEEVPNDTIMDRLLMDDTISKPLAYLIAPAFYLINFIEKFRGKTDTLIQVARKADL